MEVGGEGDYIPIATLKSQHQSCHFHTTFRLLKDGKKKKRKRKKEKKTREKKKGVNFNLV